MSIYRSFTCINFPGRFIRHQNFLGELTEIKNDLDKFDATFIISEAEYFRNGVAHLISANFPDRVLRHQNFRIKLDLFVGVLNPGQETPEHQLLREDCSFRLMAGLADASGNAVSFQSVNFPDRFIRHRDFHLFLEPADSDFARHDATFLELSGFFQPHI